jgi:hypothetical protein
MTDVAAVVSAYGAAWLERDDATRARLLETAWSDDGVFQDPRADVSGREALSRHIVGFHRRMPGARVILTSGAAHHHGKLHFTWRLAGQDGRTLMYGCSFGELDGDGRICRIVSFFGPPPPT